MSKYDLRTVIAENKALKKQVEALQLEIQRLKEELNQGMMEVETSNM